MAACGAFCTNPAKTGNVELLRRQSG